MKEDKYTVSNVWDVDSLKKVAFGRYAKWLYIKGVLDKATKKYSVDENGEITPYYVGILESCRNTYISFEKTKIVDVIIELQNETDSLKHKVDKLREKQPLTAHEIKALDAFQNQILEKQNMTKKMLIQLEQLEEDVQELYTKLERQFMRGFNKTTRK